MKNFAEDGFAIQGGQFARAELEQFALDLMGSLPARSRAWPPRMLEAIVALRVHLDDSTAANGPLRVLPGTHQLGLLGDAQVSELARVKSPVICCAPAGSVVAMRPLLIHASSKVESQQPRRVLHIEYAASLELEPGLRLRIA